MTGIVREVRAGNATLYLADNASVMPLLDRPAALIGDPPYGQSHKTNIFNAGGRKLYRCGAEGGGEKIVAANRRSRNGVQDDTGQLNDADGQRQLGLEAETGPLLEEVGAAGELHRTAHREHQDRQRGQDAAAPEVGLAGLAHLCFLGWPGGPSYVVVLA